MKMTHDRSGAGVNDEARMSNGRAKLPASKLRLPGEDPAPKAFEQEEEEDDEEDRAGGLSAEIRLNPTMEFLKFVKPRGWLKMNSRRQDAARARSRGTSCRRCGNPGNSLEAWVRQASSSLVKPFNLKKIILSGWIPTRPMISHKNT